MAEERYHNIRESETRRIVTTDVEEFKAMTIHVTDMVSDTFFQHGIITQEDRDLLNGFLHELKDIIHNMETIINCAESSPFVGIKDVLERITHTRDKYRTVVYAFDNNKSIAVTMKEDDLYKSSALASSSSDEGSTITPEVDKDRRQGIINYGYTTNVHDDDDDDYDDVACCGVGANVHVTAPYNISHKSPYGYDCDDVGTTVSGENWTFKKSNSSMSSSVTAGVSNVEDNQCFREKHSIIDLQYDNGRSPDSRMRYTQPYDPHSSNTKTDSVEEDTTGVDSNKHDAIVAHINDTNDIDDIKDILNKFDYLDDYHSKSTSTNGSSEGSAYQLEMHVNEEPQIMEFTDSVTREDIKQWVGVHHPDEGHLIANSNGFISSEQHLEMQDSSTAMELNQHELYINTVDTETSRFSEDSNRRIIDEMYPVEAEASESANIYRNIQGVKETENKEYARNATHSDTEHICSEMDGIFHTSVNTLIPRTRSDDIQSCDTSDSYGLRRTRSEAIRDRQNNYWQDERMEDFTEDLTSLSAQSEIKSISATRSCDMCGPVLKVLMLVLFGFATTKIIFGAVYRHACQVKAIVPLCILASGAVSLCFCIIFLVANMLRQRTRPISKGVLNFLIIIWLTLFGFTIAGTVLLFPSNKDVVMEFEEQTDICNRNISLLSLGANIVDWLCQLCFVIMLYRIKSE